jgi:hypothetical protein
MCYPLAGQPPFSLYSDTLSATLLINNQIHIMEKIGSSIEDYTGSMSSMDRTALVAVCWFVVWTTVGGLGGKWLGVISGSFWGSGNARESTDERAEPRATLSG